MSDKFMQTFNKRLTWIACDDCCTKHPCKMGSDEARDFISSHRAMGHTRLRLCEPSSKLVKLQRLTGADVFRMIRSRLGEWVIGFDRQGIAGYKGNANVKQSFGTASTFTKTNANIASSATAGWAGNAIDNTTNLYDDAFVKLVLASVASAPGSSKAIFMFAHGLVDSAGTLYDSTGDGTPSGSEGTLTFPDVTANPIVCPPLGTVPYPITTKAINGPEFSVAAAFNGVLPPKWLPSMINHSGMTLNVTNIEYREIFWTVS
jgi:hypothetical protein